MVQLLKESVLFFVLLSSVSVISFFNNKSKICVRVKEFQMFPIRRKFIPLADLSFINDPRLFRILQFNTLADGLSGLRPDLGAFSRTKPEDISWESRKSRLLHEIVQYEPDIISLQEVDHYYDFFLPELSARGYDGLFAPKPSSTCLEFAPPGQGDGCALFVKRSKFKIRSSETLTFAFSKSEVGDGVDKVRLAQNQVALIAVCELMQEGAVMSSDGRGRHLIVACTHLKAKKTGLAEAYRLREIQQLLGALDRVCSSMTQSGIPASVLLAGDLNALPKPCSYPALTYRAVKEHRLRFRSVFNDDLEEAIAQAALAAKNNSPDSVAPVSPISLTGGELYTTWKARSAFGGEQVSKHCIDYLFYSSAGLKAVAALDLFSEEQLGQTLLPSAMYPSDHVAIAADLMLE